MIEPRKNAGLLIELFNGLSQVQFGPALVDEEGGQNLFDRADAAIEPQVVGLIDRAHPTLTYEANDFIASAQDRI